MSKPFHVVVWGASGFTGRLVCEHIARDYKGKIVWAMAGRNKSKLESIRADLAAQYGDDIADVPILIGSLENQSSLDDIAAQTSTIVATAGPFVIHGTPVVDAAVRKSCHYVDITGEVPWVKTLIDTYHEEASKKGIRIVNCCGYDSIPSDLGALMVVDFMRNKLDTLPTSILTAVVAGKGGVSGGTIATGMNQFASDSKSQSGDSSYALIPAGTAQPGKDKDVWGVVYNDILEKYLAPFVMQVCNTRIVHRSNYLLKWGGPELSYSEGTAMSNWRTAKAVAIGSGLVTAAFKQTWLHPLLRKVLPAPGEGPSKEARDNGMFRHKTIGVDAKSGRVAVATVGDDHRDPGYLSTSRMVLEAGLALALQQDELDKDDGLLNGGVLTPASAMGHVLIDRLKKAGYTFEVEERVAGGK